MKIQSIVAGWIVLTLLVIAPAVGFTQISSNANEVIPTEYSSGAQDEIHVFCGQRGQTNASLTATSSNLLPATFEWLRYNPSTGSFDPFLTEASGSASSTISDLQDGAYRVNITTTSGVQTQTAWVFNNYIETSATIPNSDCNSFTLVGTSDTPALVYYDLTTNQPKQLNKEIQVKWTAGSKDVGNFLTVQVIPPPKEDTDYTLTVSDRFGCTSQSDVQYISIVADASFIHEPVNQTSSHPSKIEAPLSVTFRSKAVNPNKYKFHWFIYKDNSVLANEQAASPNVPIDPIMEHLYTEPATYIFEKPGTYSVKLVAEKQNPTFSCYDTVYFKDLIKIDTSFIEAPNFFTPGNNDGLNKNEEFVIRFFSMQTIKISIFNRWGKIVHVYENNNVQGFGQTRTSIPQSVWDGKVGGKLATPGVYFYVAEGRGRDGKMNKANGFVHLFRGKD